MWQCNSQLARAQRHQFENFDGSTKELRSIYQLNSIIYNQLLDFGYHVALT